MAICDNNIEDSCKNRQIIFLNEDLQTWIYNVVYHNWKQKCV